MKKTNSKKLIVIGLYEKTKNNIIISCIIPIIGLLSNLVGVFGLELQNTKMFAFLYDENSLKPIVSVSIFIFMILSLLIIIIRCIGDKFKGISTEKEMETYETLLNMEHSFRNHIYSNLRKLVIDEKKYQKIFNNLNTVSPFSNRTSRVNSVYKISLIIEQATRCFAERFGCDEANVNICLMYKENENAEWELLVEKNLDEGEYSLEQIFKSDRSTFNSVLKKPNKSEFILDKEQAIKENKYLNTDENIIDKGSIYCKNLSIYNGQNILKGCVLCIGTRKVAFCNDDIFSKKICKKMFKVLESNLKNEIIDILLLEHLGLMG